MKRDIILAAVAGFFVAALLVVIDQTGNIQRLNMIPYLELTLVAFPILAASGIYTASLLVRKIRVAYQGVKFLLVGATNTLLDLTVLNILIATTGITAGIWFSVFKAVSFLAALLNSYTWNKNWTFTLQQKNRQTIGEQAKEFTQFLGVSGTGFVLNVVSASIVANFVPPQFGIAETSWPTAAALVGTFFVLSWNFFGYKFIVFKKRST
jgi:putative flippase GtrA